MAARNARRPAAAPNEWSALLTIDHRFSTGRSALLRRSVPVSTLVRSGTWTDDLVDLYLRAAAGEKITGRADILALMDAVVCAMFVDPVVTVDGANGTVPIAALDQVEIDEALDAAFGGAATAGFPGNDAGDDASADSANVRDDPVPGDGA